MLPSYLFIREPPKFSRGAQRDWRYLVMDGTPAKIRDDEIPAPPSVVELSEASPPKFKRNQKLRIKFGPFEGTFAKFRNYYRRGDRVCVVALEALLGKETTVLVHADQLEISG
jgi:transcription antitermination factor NusG